MKLSDRFARTARTVSEVAGSPYAFAAALALIIGWAAAGPFFDWSDSHSLVINTITTVWTFLMVHLIQGSQNKDTHAINLKLDELICAIDEADNRLIALESDPDATVKERSAAVHERKEDQSS